uniref:T-cell surface glycoprotein CD3 delta chain n=1 Tax=Sarcophilus harrisii TaxID=9305 RepID=A0A7N4NU52_SARHA
MVLQKVHRWNMKCDLCLCGLILTIILLQGSVIQADEEVCQNCVEVTSGSLFGILIADIIATVILAIGVYCFAGHEEGYLPAFDKQILMQNDALYQPLRDRDDNSYSHIGGKQLRNK